MSKKDEETGGALIFGQYLDKSTVLQEARVFNESPLNTRKCRLILTKIVYLLYNGETFATREATELFFSITKLFQAKDNSLRQIVYLVIKELTSIAEDVIMVTSSLTKDMQPTSDITCRANAIRTLCKITDASMMQGIERFLKASIVDKNPAISSASLVSSYHLFGISKDVVKRWVNEVQEVANKPTITPGSVHVGQAIVQYHAIGLLYMIRQHDRMAVNKLVQGFSGSAKIGGSIKSSFAHCLLIRYACKVIEDDPSLKRQMFVVLESWLRNRSDIVIYEAAKAICTISDLSADEIGKAVTVLRGYLVSTRATFRFGAIRTLNQLAKTQPAAVARCNLDMEGLIADPNRSVATFAITTLLMTGTEASVDRLMKQISTFMAELSDEFKVIVVDAIRALCLKFPAKQAVMLSFLSGVLRDEGGYDYKKAVVEAIVDLVKSIPECKETALPHLCEYIEDCEFTKLSVRILHLLGEEGPKSQTPGKLIRFIYNRLILENSIVRAAAVSALAQFGVFAEESSELRASIKVILNRCLDDNDDEVRDRAILYLAVLNAGDTEAKSVIQNDVTYALPALERSLLNYIADPTLQENPFDIVNVPLVTKAQEEAERMRIKTTEFSNASDLHAGPSSAVASPVGGPGRTLVAATSTDQQSVYASQLEKIPEFAEYGPLFKSSTKPIELTESETEYIVSCVKHMFKKHVVFQFNVVNTIADSQLDNVTVVMTPEVDDNGLRAELLVPAEKLPCNTPGMIYVAYSKLRDDCICASFSNTLKFVVKDCDPATGEPDEEGFEDEYLLEDVSVLTADYILPAYIGEFKTTFENLPVENELVDTLELSALTSISEATTTIIDLLGMHALENTGTPTNRTYHQLLMAGTYLDGSRVLARAKMSFTAATGITMEMTIRGERLDVSRIVLGAIA